MKKATILLFTLGFIALCSCKENNEEIAGLQTPNPKTHAAVSALGLEPETFTPPTRTRGTTKLNVQNYGATGVDTSDDTDAFQAAIDALPSDGGTVWVPAGTYYIRAAFKAEPGQDTIADNTIRLRSNMHLELSPYAKIKAIANDAYVAYLIYGYNVSDIEISGGEIIGERYSHLVTTGEYGHGIQLRGCSRVTIRDTKLRDFWGDGISIGTTWGYEGPEVVGNDIVIDNIIATNNRRQGLSIGPASNVQVWDSEFSNTNGTSPQCGIDIEPEAGFYTDSVLIQNNLLSNNNGHGILLFNSRARYVTIRNCEAVDNDKSGIAGVGTDAYIAFNRSHNNNFNGVSVQSGANGTTVVQNIFYENNGNLPRASKVSIIGQDSVTAQDLFVNTATTNISILTNHYK